MRLRLGSTLPLLCLLLGGSALAEEGLRDKAKGLFEPVPQTAPGFPGDATTPEKVALGKMLFFDPRLSENQDLSCSLCHNPSMAGVSGQFLSSGHHGELGGRNVLTVFNAVFNVAQYWDGRAAGLKEQVEASIMSSPAALLKTRGGPTAVPAATTGLAKQHVIERFKTIPGYVDAFKKAFPDAADPVTYDNVARAIAQFEATLITPNSPFDRWLKGEDPALSPTQLRGLALFIEKGCAGCHSGVNLGGTDYARFGVVQSPSAELLPPDDWGRAVVTKKVEDKYVYKIPNLRNVELTAPYFHTGGTDDLKEAVAVMAATQLGVTLAPEEIASVEAFLKSLTGPAPQIVLPMLPPNPPRAQAHRGD
jgi:cytochrome c peroxidase